VAGNRLPGLVERLRDPAALSGGIEIEPVDVDTTDEIGEVARAFDEVHREAVRLAANEAVLRGNINAMFVNLSRRSQSLIERQLRIIDDLEQGERDDERLASLFRLDHLATRMRRNCENLLVLGGQDQVRKWNQPVPLLDVIRASLSEVEQYERVSLRIQGEVSVVGPVVNDLIHLIAELVENAITFSPEHTKVEITGHLLSGGGAMLQITDGGVGMSEEELDEANWRLGHRPEIDVSVARRMGLFVVGRLAGRHGIRVELRASPTGGLTAFGLLPAQLIALAEVPLVPLRRLDPPVESWRSQVQPEPQLRPPPQLQPQLRPVRSVFQSVPKPDPWAERPVVQPAQVATAGAQWTNRRVERSPIFEAMESEWFQHRDLPGDPGAWHSPADVGWQAAADVVQAPTAKGRTAAGLPQRVPGQNRLAGAVPQQTAGRQATAHPPIAAVPVAPAPAVAEAVRNRFSGLQQGVNRGRAEARAQYSETGDTQ
jgi:Histidine kinase-, DNA gyrase B-, and HSP90-like ATPase